AFTGDHNVIRAGKDSREIRGVRARVLAGIQHFSFGTEQEKIKPEDRGTIIVYTTSLGIHRSVAHKCEQARKILKGYRVKFQDRDIFNDQEHKDELYRRLGLQDGDPFPEMPRVYIVWGIRWGCQRPSSNERLWRSANKTPRVSKIQHSIELSYV
uniref:Glutaredoxin domain-containing protein n=1 Tax=Ciona savignyi TaxID=51511 RepID=H2ZCB0_CIOSA